MRSSQNIRYFPALDHLRAFAAVLVLMYHSAHVVSYQLLWQQPFAFDHWPAAGSNPFLAVIYEGHTGVALFMVLSGYLFTVGAAGQAISYGAFLRNRVLRIYPLLLALILAGIATYPQRFTLTGFVRLILPLQNLPGSLDLGAFTSMFWTIAVEFQFYLIFPFLHRMTLRAGTRSLWVIVFLTIIARAGSVAVGVSPREFYWSMLGHLDQFLIGMIAAIRVAPRVEGGRWAGAAFLGGSAGMWAALVAFNHLGGWPAESPWKILWPTVEGALWALVIVGYLGVVRGREGSRISRGLAWVGTLSYSIYLTHFLMLTLAVNHGFLLLWPGRPHASALLTGAFLILPATLAVSWVTFRSIELPFLRMRRRYLGPPVGTAN